MKKIAVILGLGVLLAGCGNTSSVVIPEEMKPLTIEQAKNSETAVVEVFSDMQCGHCKDLDPTMQKLEETLTDVDFRFYHFPFLGPNSFPSAVAVECVRLQDNTKANPYIAKVFNAKNLSTASLRSMAKDEGVNEEQFNQCLKKKETGGLIQEFMAEARARNVNSTPSIFINGAAYSGGRSYEIMKAFITKQGAPQEVSE